MVIKISDEINDLRLITMKIKQTQLGNIIRLYMKIYICIISKCLSAPEVFLLDGAI